MSILFSALLSAQPCALRTSPEGGGTVFYLPTAERPSPPDKGLRVGGGPEKLPATDNSLRASLPPGAGRGGRRLIITGPHVAVRDRIALC